MNPNGPNGPPPQQMYQRGPMPYPPGQPGFPMGHPGMPVPMQMRMQGPPPGMSPHMAPVAQVKPEVRLTLFVGKIKRGVGDDLMRSLLKCCGNLLHWRRVTDPLTNSLKAFGYAQYGSPVEVLTAMRILNGLEIQGQALLLNVDDNTRKILDEHEKKNPLKPEEQLEADSTLIAEVAQMVENYSESSGFDFTNLDPVMQQVPSVAGDERKVGIVKSEIEKFREREKKHEDDEARRQREKLKRMKKEPPRDKNKERLDELRRQVDRLRQVRGREREREYRQDERERREMRNIERKLDDWIYDMLRSKEKEEKRQRDSIKDRQRAIEREYDDEEVWQRHCKDARRRRFRARELEEDQADRITERKQRLAASESSENDDYAYGNAKGPSRVGFGLKASLSKVTTKRTSSVAAASDFDEEEQGTAALQPQQKKRKLVKLDYAEVGLQTEEEKRRREERAQKIVARIPVEKGELFDYKIDWHLVEKNKVLDEQVRPWVTSKVVELLGTAEQDVIDFVLRKVRERTRPDTLLSELEPLLDKDTELFTKMLWRLIIFHILSASTP